MFICWTAYNQSFTYITIKVISINLRHHPIFIIPLILLWLDLTSQANDISKGWLFRKGDNINWAKPVFDDSSWKPIEINQPWEKAGYKDYDGYGWYRLKVSLPKAENQGNYFKHYKRLNLSLGAIDDADVTYFNGIEIGRTGSFSNDNKSHYEKIRLYEVPAKNINWGAENVIAVRVFDSGGKGGMHKGLPTLSEPLWTDFVETNITLNQKDGIHHGDTPMDISAVISNDSFESFKGTVRFQIGSDTWLVNEREIYSDVSKSVQLVAGNTYTESIRFEPPAPGFYQVTCTFTRDGDKTPIKASRMRAYAPEKMVRPPEPPKDLREFWDETITELSAVEPKYKIEPKPKFSTSHTDCFLVEMRSLGNVRIRGWFEVPKSKGPHPVLIRVPGYTQAMQPAQEIQDMAVLSLNIRGHGNSTDDEPAYEWWGPGDYLLRGLDDPRKFFYRGAIMDCLRGVDFVASRTEVDSKRIGMTGGSQGGMLSFGAAAIDKRITLIAPDIPFVVDSMKSFKMTEWPGMVVRHWLGRNPKNTWELAKSTFAYVDPKNLAEWIKCPVFMGVGLQDTAATAPTAFSAYNQVRSPKEFRLYPEAGHSTPPEHKVLKMQWIREQFGISKAR